MGPAGEALAFPFRYFFDRSFAETKSRTEITIDIKATIDPMDPNFA